MTSKEAIEAIKANYPPANYTILREALDLAIKVLEKCEGGNELKKIDEIISICRLILSDDEPLDKANIETILDLAREIKSES
jgi:hypothetical protein